MGYRRGGAGETILLIHGLAGSSKTWDDVIPLLTPHADVIAVDLLGHGESAKPTGDYSLGAFASGLRDFLSILGIDSVTIVGHSFGGGVAMQLAYQHPHLVDRLVLVGSGGLGREVSWLLRLLTLPGAEYVMPFAFPKPIVDRATDVGRQLGRRNIRSPKLAEMWRAYSSLAGATNRKAFVRTMRGVIEPTGQMVNATDRLYLAAHVPTMIVWGDHDGIIPVEHASRRPRTDPDEPTRDHRGRRPLPARRAARHVRQLARRLRRGHPAGVDATRSPARGAAQRRMNTTCATPSASR